MTIYTFPILHKLTFIKFSKHFRNRLNLYTISFMRGKILLQRFFRKALKLEKIS